MATMPIPNNLLREMRTNEGKTLADLSSRQPIMLIFLRHFGCTFCREALADIAKKRKDLESYGTKIVFVHMTDNATAERYFQRYDLAGISHVSDPPCYYYREFGLVKGNFTQLFGLTSWIRGFEAGVIKGHGVGTQLGDGFQMPGVFVIQEGAVVEAFIHKLSSDRPDYVDLMQRCCSINPSMS